VNKRVFALGNGESRKGLNLNDFYEFGIIIEFFCFVSKIERVNRYAMSAETRTGIEWHVTERLGFSEIKGIESTSTKDGERVREDSFTGV